MDVIGDIVNTCTNLISNGGFIIGFILVFIESFLPFLPLGVITTLNINAFGFLFGTILSWIATCTGCIVVYTLIYNISNKYIYKFFKEKTKKQIDKAINKFQNIKLSTLTLIVTLPFTPSFLVNILSGIAGIKKEKFITAILIGKLFMISFCGIIGKSFLESMTDIKSLIFITLALLIAYIISKIVSKKMHIE